MLIFRGVTIHFLINHKLNPFAHFFFVIISFMSPNLPTITLCLAKSGDIADLYASDEKDAIRNGVRSGCKGAGIQETKG